MPIELIVFDMAGTTVYDGDMVNIGLREALAAADTPVTHDEINAVMGIAKPVAIRTLLQAKSPLNAAVLEDKVQAIYADFLARMLHHYRNSPELREVDCASDTFRRLKAAGIKIALDTGFSRPIADAIIDRLGWQRDGLIDTSVTSDEVANGRPYPDLIYKAMALTGVNEAASVAKVGDTPVDLQEGRAAGCGLVIGITSGSHTREELLPYPHTHLIHTLPELLTLLLNVL